MVRSGLVASLPESARYGPVRTNKNVGVQRDLPESVPTAIVYNPGMGGCKLVTNQALIVGGMQDVLGPLVPPLRLRARILGMEPLDRKRLAQLLQLAAVPLK
jgi:hypothetical protein